MTKEDQEIEIPEQPEDSSMSEETWRLFWHSYEKNREAMEELAKR